MRGWLSERTATAAEQRAEQIGVGADRVLISTGAIDEEIYLRLLADSLGIVFEPLDAVARRACPFDDERLIEAPATGFLPLNADGDLQLVIAPRRLAARGIIHLLGSRPELVKTIRLTTAARLQSFIVREAGEVLGERATNDLARKHREMSAAPPRWKPPLAPILAIGAASYAAVLLVPSTTKLVCDVFLSLIFLSWMVLRLVGLLIGHSRLPKRERLPDKDLPIYTILVSLYREVSSVGGLVESLRRLDYPGVMAQTPLA